MWFCKKGHVEALSIVFADLYGKRPDRHACSRLVPFKTKGVELNMATGETKDIEIESQIWCEAPVEKVG